MTAIEQLGEMRERAFNIEAEYEDDLSGTPLGEVLAEYDELISRTEAILAMEPRRKRLTKDGKEIYQHAWVDGQTATLTEVKALIEGKVG